MSHKLSKYSLKHQFIDSKKLLTFLFKMVSIQLLIIISVLIVILTTIEGQRRRPQPIEHTYCSLMFAEELDHARNIDRRAISQAYRVIDCIFNYSLY